MAQKNATPTKEQAEAIRRAGYDPAEWVVAKALVHIMFIRHRTSGATKKIKK